MKKDNAPEGMEFLNRNNEAFESSNNKKDKSLVEPEPESEHREILAEFPRVELKTNGLSVVMHTEEESFLLVEPAAAANANPEDPQVVPEDP